MGRVAVTGSDGGLGRAIRARLQAEGHLVVGVDLRDADVVADLSEPDGRARALSALGRAPLDGFVAAAGVPGTLEPSLVARVNYFGAVELLDGLRDHLAPDGAAVAISSNSATVMPPGEGERFVERCLAGDEAGAAREAESLEGMIVYGLSKLAVARAVRRRAAEWGAAGVRLNAVAPGPVPTALLEAVERDPVYGPALRDFPVPLGRWGAPEDVAEAVAFLLRAPWVHGAVLFVDGGTDALLRPDAV